MNPEELLQSVAILIENRPFAIKKIYHVCYWKDEFCCLPCNHTVNPHPIFLVARDETLTVGLDNHQWDNLLHDLHQFTKGEKKWHEKASH